MADGWWFQSKISKHFVNFEIFAVDDGGPKCFFWMF